MTVVIRMKRSGRRNRPCYRISVADSRSPRDGRTIESLGLYDPIAPRAEMRLSLDVERARHWIQKGAQPSETVRSMFKRSGVYEGLPRPKKRERAGRKATTRTHRAREATKAARQEAKAERARARRREKAEAAKAAKAAEAPAGA